MADKCTVCGKRLSKTDAEKMKAEKYKTCAKCSKTETCLVVVTS